MRGAVVQRARRLHHDGRGLELEDAVANLSPGFANMLHTEQVHVRLARAAELAVCNDRARRRGTRSVHAHAALPEAGVRRPRARRQLRLQQH